MENIFPQTVSERIMYMTNLGSASYKTTIIVIVIILEQ
jgi:hypothetical protein